MLRFRPTRFAPGIQLLLRFLLPALLLLLLGLGLLSLFPSRSLGQVEGEPLYLETEGGWEEETTPEQDSTLAGLYGRARITLDGEPFVPKPVVELDEQHDPDTLTFHFHRLQPDTYLNFKILSRRGKKEFERNYAANHLGEVVLAVNLPKRRSGTVRAHYTAANGEEVSFETELDLQR